MIMMHHVVVATFYSIGVFATVFVTIIRCCVIVVAAIVVVAVG